MQEKRQNQNQMIQKKRQSSVSSTTLEISTKDYVLNRNNDNFKQFIESNKVQQWMENNSINSITDKAALVEVY